MNRSKARSIWDIAFSSTAMTIGISWETFRSIFGNRKVDVSNYDFTALDTIMPHPDYSSQFFICVLSPSETTFETLRLLLAEAYAVAKIRYDKRRDH